MGTAKYSKKLRDKVAEIIVDASKVLVPIWIGPHCVKPADIGAIGRFVAADWIPVWYLPKGIPSKKPAMAMYVSQNKYRIRDFRNAILIGPKILSVSAAEAKTTMVHEAVHAANDWVTRRATQIDDEAMAFTAEAILRIEWSRSPSGLSGPAVDVAREILADGRAKKQTEAKLKRALGRAGYTNALSKVDGIF